MPKFTWNEMIKNELNKFEVIESQCSGGELEYVLIEDTKCNREQLNYFLCAVNTWAYVPQTFSPSMHEFINYCEKECKGYLDLTYLIYNLIQNANVETEELVFNQKNNEWELFQNNDLEEEE